MDPVVRERNRHDGVWFLLSLLCLLTPAPRPAAGTTYSVDAHHPQARGTNPGTEALPLQTIGQATPLLQAGDTLLVKAGVYRETVTLSQSGTATAPITIAAYSPQHLRRGHRVQHDGQSVRGRAAGDRREIWRREPRALRG